MRDDFTKPTIRKIAERAGFRCSNPNCRSSTIGAAQGHDGSINTGVAAHITAAAPGGPRYDPSLSRDERRNAANGLWLCQTHGKLVDSDSEHFTVEMLRKWKQDAERQSFLAITAPHAVIDQRIRPSVPETANHELTERLGLPVQDDLGSVTSRLIGAAQSDLAAFKRTSAWPRHAVALNLRMHDGNNLQPFNASGLVEAIDAFNEIVIIAPPGTGKTTTLLQVSEAILLQGESVAAFIPLGEWSSQPDSFFQSVVRRHAFDGTREAHLKLLAHFGQLVLVLDGWNELDSASRRRAGGEIKLLRREFPDLGIIVSTRRQALDTPISGPVVEIDALADDQQLELARALRGSQGEAILDHAWRTPGIRELVAIPLYLTALLSRIPGGTLPTTKEEVLRMFVTEIEQATDKAEALRATIFGFHMEMLTALAVEATRAANTTISDRRAHAVVNGVAYQLRAEGQITTTPQPAAILDVLVSQHTLVRSGAGTGGLSFQHQQFQEWYASFEVETLMRVAATGDRNVSRKLNAVVLNMRAWEEPILFACERVSRSDKAGLQAVATLILETMAIDPMLAAEMIYRSSAGVWDPIKEKIIAFAGRWHTGGKVDRAVHFMISTGRSEFAPLIWPLISDANMQVHLPALRAGRRFRPPVLGADVQARITQLPEEVREHVISEIASHSGMDGIELAARLAQVDPSPKVQVSVVEALLFRRADRFVAEILRTAPDEVWHLLGRKGYAEEITDPDAAARLHRERRRYIESETDPLRKLSALLDAKGNGEPLGHEVGALIEASGFPAKDEHAGGMIEEAHKRYPDEVVSALLHRLEAGREIPFRTEDLLRIAGIEIDEGPIVDLVMRSDIHDKVAGVAVSIVGPQTVGRLIDNLVAIDANLRASEGRVDEATHDKYFRLSGWISNTGLVPFIRAVLSRSGTHEPREIVLLADLLARHGKEGHEGPLQLDDKLYEQMIAAVEHWAEVLLASPTANRAQLAEVARAIERLAAPQLVPALQHLLVEDLARWRRARDDYTAAIAREISTERHPDVYTSWTLQYRRAFIAIGDNHVVELMKAYLPDAGFCGFGFDAACVLKGIWDREQSSTKDRQFTSWPDFSDVKARRIQRQSRGGESSPFADAILAVVDEFVKPDSGDDAHRHALQLAKIAFGMPYGNRTNTIGRLLQLPQPLRTKQEVLAVLVVAGEIIHADIILDGIKTLLEEAKAKPWLLGENHGELERWLELLPFSDRPIATLDALALLEPSLRQPWRLRRLLSALGYAPSSEAERVLDMLPQQDSRFLSEHDWLTALRNRGTVSAARMLLGLICAGVFACVKGGLDTWTLSKHLANAIRAHADFRAEVCHRYESLPASPGKAVLEHAIAEVADTESVLTLVRGYAAQRKTFDGVLHTAIRHVALGERPSTSWVGANEVFGVPIPELRKRLFAMAKDDTAESRLASACLTAIDEIRDDYGPSESEPRHPDIESGRPWPLLAS